MLSNPRAIKLTAAAITIAIVCIALFLRFQSVDQLTSTTDPSKSIENPLEKARGTLRQTRDLPSCRAALQQANTYLARERDTASYTLEPAVREDLLRQFNLTPGELAEIEHPNFTLLDGIHLEFALLMHDVVRGLVPGSEGALVRSPEQVAAVLFGWVMRQVQTAKPAKPDDPEVVPQLELRRGAGSPLARALLLAALAEQADLDACLLSFPVKTNEIPRYWACGILGSGGKIYLFDTRLGLPLPGPGGTGIATLDQLALKDSPALKALELAGEAKYDVTPEIAAGAELHLVVSLSALAPRMRFLEKEVLRPVGGGRVVGDPSALATRFRTALAKSSHVATVKPAAWAARLQRGFFPKVEGGTDTQEQSKQRFTEFNASLAFANRAPLDRILRNSLGVEYQGSNEETRRPPLEQLFTPYLTRFLDFFLNPAQPRELMLRGNLADAARKAGTASDQFQQARDAFRTYFKDMDALGQVRAWYAEATQSAAVLAQSPDDPSARSAVFQTHRKYAQTLGLLVEGAACEELVIHVAYLRAMIKHEQAERLHLRLRTVPNKEELEEVRQTWRDALDLWNDSLFTEQQSQPGRVVQPLKARAQQMLAEVLRVQARTDPSQQEPARDATLSAAALWEDLGGKRTDLEALGYHFLATQLRRR